MQDLVVSMVESRNATESNLAKLLERLGADMAGDLTWERVSFLSKQWDEGAFSSLGNPINLKLDYFQKLDVNASHCAVLALQASDTEIARIKKLIYDYISNVNCDSEFMRVAISVLYAKSDHVFELVQYESGASEKITSLSLFEYEQSDKNYEIQTLSKVDRAKALALFIWGCNMEG